MRTLPRIYQGTNEYCYVILLQYNYTLITLSLLAYRAIFKTLVYRGNFGMGVRASISKPTPFIYLAFEKTDPFLYLIIQNVDLFIYCPLTFLYPFFAGYYTNITVSSCNTKRITSLEKSLSEKYVHIPGCRKNGAFYTGIQKNRAIHILFVEKRGPIIYLAALKKGAIRHAHAIYRKLPPLPPAPRDSAILSYALADILGRVFLGRNQY